MNKSSNFKGKIQFVGPKSSIMKYSSPSFHEDFEEKLCDTMMASFESMQFSTEEKKHLSRNHRKLINYYRHISNLSLESDAKQLVLAINHSKQTQFVIEANHYGAYVCLAALYSGKLSSDKKIEFILEKAPLALFPESFMKFEPKNPLHKVIFHLSEDCWLSPFSSLYNNQKIKYSLAKKPIKKAA
jgi:hypothetical protein